MLVYTANDILYIHTYIHMQHSTSCDLRHVLSRLQTSRDKVVYCVIQKDVTMHQCVINRKDFHKYVALYCLYKKKMIFFAMEMPVVRIPSLSSHPKHS